MIPSLLTKITTWARKPASPAGPIDLFQAGLLRGLRTMTKPISAERAEWLQQRLKVVEASVALAQSQMYQMQGGGVANRELQTALFDFQAERTRINIELRVLKDLGVAP